MRAKHIIILIVAVIAVPTSLYFHFRTPQVSENQKPVVVEGELVKKAERFSLEIRKMADQRSLRKLERCSAFEDNFLIGVSAEQLRKFSKKGWKIERMTNTPKNPETYDCHIINDEGQKGVMVLKSSARGKHWGIVCFNIS